MGVRQPAGVVVGIAPWNAPVILATRAVATPLAYGNTVVLKASEKCPRTHAAVVRAIADAGLPAGVDQPRRARAGGRAGGGRGADRPPGRAARQLHRLHARRPDHRRQVRRAAQALLLELGGKAPHGRAAPTPTSTPRGRGGFGAFMNSGQICMSTERIVVDRGRGRRARRAARRAGAAARRRRPARPGHDDRPGRRRRARASACVGADRGRARRKGADVLAGGEADGNLIAPTVLAGVTPAMRSTREESFGPVVAIVPVDGADEAVRVANDTEYGLSAAVFGGDVDARAGGRAADRVAASATSTRSTVHDEPQMPFGGVKASRLGPLRRPRRAGGVHGPALDVRAADRAALSDLSAARALQCGYAAGPASAPVVMFGRRRRGRRSRPRARSGASSSERHLQPGERLGTEQELAAEFGVSRPTLREALRLLVGVTADPRRARARGRDLRGAHAERGHGPQRQRVDRAHARGRERLARRAAGRAACRSRRRWPAAPRPTRTPPVGRPAGGGDRRRGRATSPARRRSTTPTSASTRSSPRRPATTCCARSPAGSSRSCSPRSWPTSPATSRRRPSSTSTGRSCAPCAAVSRRRRSAPCRRTSPTSSRSCARWSAVAEARQDLLLEHLEELGLAVADLLDVELVEAGVGELLERLDDARRRRGRTGTDSRDHVLRDERGRLLEVRRRRAGSAPARPAAPRSATAGGRS